MAPDLTATLQQIVASDAEREAEFRILAEAIRASGPYRWVGIYDVDMSCGLVSNIAWSGPSGPAHPRFPTTKGLTSRAIASKKTVNVSDIKLRTQIT